MTPMRLKIVIHRLVLALLATMPGFASTPLGCQGSQPLARFEVLIRPFSKGAPLPLKSVAEIPAGSHLIWNPLHLMPQVSANAQVAVVLVPASESRLITLEPRKASVSTDWQLVERPQVIALLFGPQGLSEGKIQSLVTRDRELLRELADYAEQSSEVESLVQQLADAQKSGSGADAVLKGFSSQYGAAAPRLDTKASSDQQAALLLKALLPASTAYDPLASRGAQVQQSGGLAASVAEMFFGNPVALAAGGAALFQNLKTALFPNTEFRSAFTQDAEKNDLALCTKDPESKSKTHTAYLWAYRVPEHKKPVLSLEGAPRLPLGSKSAIAVKLGKDSTPKEFAFVRDWRLTPASGGASIPVAVGLAGPASITIDLSAVHASPGDYRLEATWDWSPLEAAGTLHLDRCGDFAHVALAPRERDKLIEGNGKVPVELTGADFEFLEKAALESLPPEDKPVDVTFTLPAGKRRGPQNSVKLNLDTARQGAYRLLLAQSDGVEHAIPITILPPNPKIANHPVRVNLGESHQTIHFQGSGMERIEAVSSNAGEIAGKPDAHGWSGEISLKTGLTKGQMFPVLLKVQGLDDPVKVPDAIEVIGPRPKIRSVQKSLSGNLGIDIERDELPVGTAVGLVLTVSHLRHSSRPQLELGCQTGELRQSLTLSPGEPSDGAALTFSGPEALYLSLDPGAVGYAGCELAATVDLGPDGRSDPVVLGRVIRVPRLDRFTLTSEKVGDSNYSGILEGRDLDVIEKTGWDATHGVPVDSIAAPLPGDPTRQTLRIALPWPAPAPHAPLYVWLRGEAQGRKTTVTY